MTTRPTTDGDTKAALEAVTEALSRAAYAYDQDPWSFDEEQETPWPHGVADALERLTTRISEQEAELERLRVLEREVKALVADTPSPPAWYEVAPSYNGYRLEHAYAAGYDVAQFYLRRALTPTTQDQSEGT